MAGSNNTNRYVFTDAEAKIHEKKKLKHIINPNPNINLSSYMLPRRLLALFLICNLDFYILL